MAASPVGAEAPAPAPEKSKTTSLPAAALAKAHGAAAGVVGTLEAGVAGTLGILKNTLGAHPGAKGAKAPAAAGAPQEDVAPATAPAGAPAAAGSRRHGKGAANAPASGAPAGAPEHGSAAMGPAAGAPEYGASAMAPEVGSPAHHAFTMELGASGPTAESEEAEEAPAGAPEAEAGAEGEATGPSASEGLDAAAGPGSEASSEEAAFPPDAPIAGEAPMAEVTTSDNSAPATEATPAAATAEGPAAATAEAPGPDSEEADASGANVVVASGGLGAVVAFLATVVSFLDAVRCSSFLDAGFCSSLLDVGRCSSLLDAGRCSLFLGVGRVGRCGSLLDAGRCSSSSPSRAATPTSALSSSLTAARPSLPIESMSMMDKEGPNGDEPDYHPEELEGHEGEMELFIVPPDPPRTRQKRPRTRAQQQEAQPQPQPQPSAEQPPSQPTVSSKLKSKVWLDFTKISKEGTKYPTANLYFMNVFLVHSAMIEASAGINSYMGPMLAVMREKFMKYWSDYSVFLSCAAVLDPRIKFKFLGYAYSKLYDEDDARRRITDVTNTLTSLFNEYGSGVSVNENIAAAGSSSTCGLGAFADYDQYMESTSSHDEKSELDLYLAKPVKKLNENVDILDYWNKSAARYPQLAKMARDILAVPVSSVASESAFSLKLRVQQSKSRFWIKEELRMEQSKTQVDPARL
ncbi:hypothetical protein ACQ4PT_020667 [Festuca glaucescens]